MKYFSAITFAILSLCVYAQNSNWAVLVAGSTGYQNYRHQSDIFHAYQILISQGYSKEHIIVFAYDDIAMNQKNPIPGKIFNHPFGKDVYEGVVIDYRGKDVTIDNYISALLGEEEKMRGIGTGKVLKSTPKDNVFLYFSDHGSKKILVFPEHQFFKEPQMIDLLTKMHQKKNYNQIVYYVEACYSGSMFLNLPKDWNIWVTTAANPDQSSYASFCGGSATINGIKMNTCLGDEYSTAWMEDTITNKDNGGYTLLNQFENLRKRVKGSQVCSFGDATFAENNAIETIFTTGQSTKWKDWEMVIDNSNSFLNEDNEEIEEGIRVDSRDAYLYSMKYEAMTSNDDWAMHDYKNELVMIKRSKKIFQTFRKELGLTEVFSNGETDFDCLDVAFNLYKTKCGFEERDYRHLDDLTNACTANINQTKIYDTISAICDSFEFKNYHID